MNRKQAAALVGLMDVIKAFAEGEEVQVQSRIPHGIWVTNPDPLFSPGCEYRIKPETVTIKYRRYVFKGPSGGYYVALTTPTLSTPIGQSDANDLGQKFIKWIDEDWITEEVEITDH